MVHEDRSSSDPEILKLQQKLQVTFAGEGCKNWVNLVRIKRMLKIVFFLWIFEQCNKTPVYVLDGCKKALDPRPGRVTRPGFFRNDFTKLKGFTCLR